MAKILTVDDAVSIRTALSHILSSLGHQVISKENGREALEFAREEEVDLVITDLNMPEMNGMSLIGSLRRLDTYQGVPILVMTTETDEYKKKKARGVGATGWIAKPFTEERIVNALQKVLRN
ncbi:MAG: response regulator [Pseudomonadales bacterium]|nr:response regulator [Pseudomonadales bacterium]